MRPASEVEENLSDKDSLLMEYDVGELELEIRWCVNIGYFYEGFMSYGELNSYIFIV